MQKHLLNTPAPSRASTAEKKLVARYLARHPRLREGMKRAPPVPLSWWALLRQAEHDAGILLRPTIRAVYY